MPVAKRKYVRKSPKVLAKVTQAGTRRSEENTVEAKPVETAKRFMGKDNEDPRFPGYRTVIVPRDDPRDAMHMSPVGAYEGKGYIKLSEDTQYTGHAGHVLMGIDIDTHIKREDDRLAEHNSRFVNGYAPDLMSTRGDNDPLKFYKEGSGVKPNPTIKTHAQLSMLRG